MFFRATYTTDILLSAPEPVPFRVTGRQGHQIRVELREVTAADNLKDITTLCTAFAEFEPSDGVVDLLRGLKDGTLALEEERVVYSDVTTTSTGEREDIPTGLRRERAPKRIEDFATQVDSELSEAAERVLRNLRWRYGLKSGYRAPHGVLSTDFSFDAIAWHPLPLQISLSGFGVWTYPLTLSDDVRAVVQSVLDSVASEPLGHVLFREARELAASNPRSALIVAVAAAEVGFKECVADLVPDATWLIENMPSPDLVRMLREYLPVLPTRLRTNRGVIAPPPALLGSIRTGVQLRNRVVHGRQNSLPATS